MKMHPVKKLVGSALLVFAVIGPAAEVAETIPPMIPVPVPANFNAGVVRQSVPHLRAPGTEMSLLRTMAEYSYEFRGQANCSGQPCANVNVRVRVLTRYDEQTQEVTTGADGKYAVTVSAIGAPDVPASWEVTGVAPSQSQIALEGRQILTDDSKVAVDNTLDF